MVFMSQIMLLLCLFLLFYNDSIGYFLYPSLKSNIAIFKANSKSIAKIFINIQLTLLMYRKKALKSNNGFFNMSQHLFVLICLIRMLIDIENNKGSYAHKAFLIQL